MAVISIARQKIKIGDHQYMPDEKLPHELMEKITPELADYLTPGESRAKKVARAIRRLHIQAIRDCLAE